MELANVNPKKTDRKQIILRLSPHKYEKLKRYAATQSMVEGRSVTVQRILESLVDSLITPATLLQASGKAREE